MSVYLSADKVVVRVDLYGSTSITVCSNTSLETTLVVELYGCSNAGSRRGTYHDQLLAESVYKSQNARWRVAAWLGLRLAAST